MRVVQLSDSHLLADPGAQMRGCATDASFRRVLAAALGERPDLLLLTGDLSQDGSEASYARLAAALRETGVPWAALPGNHDEHAALEAWLAPTPVLRRGGWRLVLLDTVLPGKVRGQLREAELARLDAELAAATAAGEPALVAVHHPPFLVGSRVMDELGIRNRDAFFAVADRHAGTLRVVLSGHVHQERRVERAGVVYLACPSTCVQFAPERDQVEIDEAASPGYRVLTLGPDGALETRVVRVG